LGSDFVDTDTGIGNPDHGNNFDGDDPRKRPKWWHSTNGDAQVGEIIKGRSSRGKRKQQPNTFNFAPMDSVQEVYEPHVFEEVKGRFEWEKAMAVEHESLMKKNLGFHGSSSREETHWLQMGIQCQVQGRWHA
jgi:hypothetical protein